MDDGFIEIAVYAHVDQLVSFFLRKGFQIDDAKDFSQEVFLRALRNLTLKKRRPICVKSWLFRIAKNLLIDQNRKRNAERRNFGHRMSRECIEDLAASQEDEHLTRQIDALNNGMCHLTKRQRQVVGYWKEGLSHDEIAHRLNRSKRTSERIFQSACDRLRDRVL